MQHTKQIRGADTITKFKITEGNDLIPLMPDFAELYNQKQPMKTILKKLQISKGKYRTLLKYCSEENMITIRNKGKRRKIKNRKPPSKYYYNKRKGNLLYFTVAKNSVYYCNCKTVEEAETIIKELKKCDWDKSKVAGIQKKVRADLGIC